MMKRIASIMLTGALVVSCALFAACSQATSSSASSSESASAQSASAGANASSDASASSASEASSSSASTSSTSSTQASADARANSSSTLEDGTYTVVFKTDSSMFHVNEAYDDVVPLVVKDGQMTAHVTLASKGILNLFVGKAEDAAQPGAQLLEPVVEVVDYGDGTSDEAYAYDIPIPALDEPFDVAIIGEKGKWYDHVVTASNPQRV